MNGKQLRASILQEAIAGRLVSQNSSDKPASELLHRINPKAKPLETGQPLPQGWCACQLKDVVSITTGDKDANHGKENGQYDFFTCALIPIKSDTYSFEGESLILPGNGANVGVVTHYNGRFEAYQRTYVLQALSADVYLRYLYWHMSANWRAYNEDKLYGSAIPYIKYGNLATYPVYLPPLSEQKRIVAKIEELMPLVDKYEKAQDGLNGLNTDLKGKLRASILQEAIAGRLVPQDPRDEPASKLLKRIDSKFILQETDQPFPQGWSVAPLSMLCELTDGESVQNRELINLDAKFLRGQREGNKLKSGKLVPAGSLLMLVDGENSGEVFRAPIEGYQGSTFRKLVIDKNMHEEFVLQVINSHRTKLRKNKRGVAIPHLDKKLFREIQVLVPPLAEQKRIVAKIEELFTKLDALSV